MLLTAFGKKACAGLVAMIQISRMFKIVAFTILSFLLQLPASAHPVGITLSLKNVSLETVFIKVQEQSAYRFIYTSEQLNGTNKVSLSVQNASIQEVLSLSFKDQPLTYTLEDQFIIVRSEVKDDHITATAGKMNISGKVSNEKGEWLQAVTVSLKGTSRAITTDEKGAFEFHDIDSSSSLIFTSVGYQSLQMSAKGKRELIVQMKQAAQFLDEKIIKGYYNTSRRLNTGSVYKVTAKEISDQPVANPLAALEGLVPGMVVTQSNGLPGSAYKVQVRGQNSLLQGSDPLFVIDGVPFAPNNSSVNQISSAASNFGGGLSPFNSINPNDIESIEILKDADATAIYGSRGANGVVLISTKKGRAGKTAVSANVYSGVSTITRSMNWLNTPQYLNMRHQAFANDGVSPDINSAPDLLVWDTTRYTDFKKTLIGGKAHTTDAQLSLSGGNSEIQFLLGGSYHRETTVFPGNLADSRAAFHANIIYNAPDARLKMNFSSIYSSDKNQINSADLTSYLNLAPNSPELYDSLGHLNWQEGGVTFNNPMAYVLQKYTASTDHLLSNLLISYRILPGLTVKTSAGYNTFHLDEVNTNPIESQNPAYSPLGYSQFGNNAFKSWILEPQIEYTKEIKQLKLNALVGGSWQQSKNSNTAFFAYGYSNDQLLESIGAASSLTLSSSSASEYRYAAIFGRLNLNWKEKYLLNISGRRDGSSRFGPGKQFANFGAVGAAWIFTAEPFFEKHLNWLSFGKIRTSYGSSGNDQIGDYQFLDSWTNTPYPYQGNAGLYPNRLFNPDYSWEINRKFEAALELGLIKDRIFLTAAWYRNRSSNQLIQYALPTQTGFSSVINNFPAVVENSGFEFSLMTKNIVSGGFNWTTGFNISLPSNKLISFPGLDSTTYANKYIVGQPLSVIRGFQFLGVDPNSGIFQFNDRNHDGVLDLKDFVQLGHLDPVFYGSFRNSFAFKGFQLEIVFEFRKQLGQNYFTSIYNPGVLPPGTMGNQPTNVLARWQKAGDITGIQQFSATPGTDASNALNYLGSSDAIYSDASFVRLKNVFLAYSFPIEKLKNFHLNGLRIYMQAQNLITITNYMGSDPETQNLFALPPLKTITAGIQFNF